jgi:hypothetical protein
MARWSSSGEGSARGGDPMNIKRLVLNLSPEETLRLTRILLDEDRDEALAFLKECIKPQLDNATREH